MYYEDARLIECEAQPVQTTERKGHPAVVLDRTIFYPDGGGQPCDLGSIAGVEVLDVQEEAGTVYHVLAAPLPTGDGPLLCRIDAGRRRDHAEQHTGQHLLSATVLRFAGGATVSFHLGREHSTIDVDLADCSRETADAVEDAAAEIIRENHRIVIHECPPERVSDFPLRRPPPPGEESLRIVDMDGLDYSACCGTHLPDTGSIGALHILRTERYKGMTRIYFVAGERARLDARRTAAVAREAARVLGCSEDEAPNRAARELDRLREFETRLSRVRAERAEAEALVFLADAADSGPLVLPLSDRGYDEVVELAKAVAGRSGRPALAASRTELRAVAAAPDPSFRLGDRLKPLMAESGGRGGGGAAQFQAQFADEGTLKAFLDASRTALSA